MKYEKTKLNGERIGQRFYSEHSRGLKSLLNQAGENKGGWGSTHDLWNVKESGIPIAYFIGIPGKEHEKIEGAAGLAGYHVDFSPSVTDFLHWKEDNLEGDVNRYKLSPDLLMFKRYDFKLPSFSAEWEKEAESKEHLIRYGSPIPVKREFNKLFGGDQTYQSVNLINHLKENDLANGVEFALYDTFKEDVDEEVLKKINEKTGLEFLKEDKTRYPHRLYEFLRNKNQYLFEK